MASTLTDITTLVSIDSCFGGQYRCPFGPILAGEFGDLFIWSNDLRYVQPIPEDRPQPLVPEIIKEFRQHNTDPIAAEHFLVSSAPVVAPGNVDEYFANFVAFIRANRQRYEQWLRLHQTSLVNDEHRGWLGRSFYLDPDQIVNLPRFPKALEELKLGPSQLIYGLDVSMRYPCYGRLAGEDNFYLSHPIRRDVGVPTSEPSQATPRYPFSFGETLAEMAPRVSRAKYIDLLVRARNLVRQRDYVRLRPGQIEVNELRDIAAALHLPAKIKRNIRIPVVGALNAAAIITGHHYLHRYFEPLVDSGTIIIESALGVGAMLWSAKFPIPSARWLNRALRWPLEKQSNENTTKESSE